MGLSISVGILAEIQQNDPEMVSDLQEQFDQINEVLFRHRLPEHEEPTELQPWKDPLDLCGFPYSWIHYLRRYYAHRLVAPGKMPPLLSPGQDPTGDPILDRISSPKSHLLWHSDCEGFYVPVDFPKVIEDDEVPGGALGPSQRLLAELRSLATPLGFELNGDEVSPQQVQAVSEMAEDAPLFIEKSTWIVLLDAAKASVARRAAISFG